MSDTQPSGSSWTLKQINVTIGLGTGTLGLTGQNKATLSNLRVVCSIQKSGFPAMDKAEARVYGVEPSDAGIRQVQMMSTVLRANASSDCLDAPARARIAIECSMADASVASTGGLAPSCNSPFA